MGRVKRIDVYFYAHHALVVALVDSNNIPMREVVRLIHNRKNMCKV